jgi:DNA-binding transcriptional ArsR family regulator
MPMSSPDVVPVLKALADETRLAITERLGQRESRVVDLVAELRIPQSTVSGHLAILRRAGLVTGRVDGRQTHYRLTKPCVLELVRVAERLVGAGSPARRLRR